MKAAYELVLDTTRAPGQAGFLFQVFQAFQASHPFCWWTFVFFSA